MKKRLNAVGKGSSKAPGLVQFREIAARPCRHYETLALGREDLPSLIAWLRREDLDTELRLNLVSRRTDNVPQVRAIHFRTMAERLKFALGLEMALELEAPVRKRTAS